MTERNTTKATFVIDRVYPAKPARVFKAFSDEQSKAKWFGPPTDWEQLERSFDFRVDGGTDLYGRGCLGGEHRIRRCHKPMPERIQFSWSADTVGLARKEPSWRPI